MARSSKYTREDILRKAKAIIDHAESAKEIGNLKEAEAFSNKLHSFLQKHNLELAEAEGFQQRREEEINHTDYDDHVIVDEKAQYGRWEQNLLDVLCRYNYCKIILYGNKTNDGQRVIIVGTQENISVVKYLHGFLSRTLLKMGEDFYDEKRHQFRMQSAAYAKNKTEAAEQIAEILGMRSAHYLYDNVVRLKNEYADDEKLKAGFKLYGVQEFGKLSNNVSPMGYKPKFVESYLNGAVVGIRNKLEEEMRDLKPDVKEKAEGLVKVNDAAIKKYMESEFGNLGKSKARQRSVNGSAYQKGKKDGRGLSIRKGVSAGTTGQRSLNS